MKDSLHVTILYCNYFVIICCFRQRELKLALNVCHKIRAKCVRFLPQIRGSGQRAEGAPGLAVRACPAALSGAGRKLHVLMMRPCWLSVLAVGAAKQIVIFITEDVFPTKSQ